MSKIMQKRLAEIADNPAYSEEFKKAAVVLQKGFATIGDDEPPVVEDPKGDDPVKTYEDGLKEARAEFTEFAGWAEKEARDWAGTSNPDEPFGKIMTQFADQIKSKIPEIKINED